MCRPLRSSTTSNRLALPRARPPARSPASEKRQALCNVLTLFGNALGVTQELDARGRVKSAQPVVPANAGFLELELFKRIPNELFSEYCEWLKQMYAEKGLKGRELDVTKPAYAQPVEGQPIVGDLHNNWNAERNLLLHPALFNNTGGSTALALVVNAREANITAVKVFIRVARARAAPPA